MSIDEKIAEVCQGISGLTYHFNDWTRANISMDDVALPVLINLLPVEGITSINGDRWREGRECLFAFMDQTDIDSSATEDHAVVNCMREYKRAFLVALNKSGYFKPIEGDVKDSVVTDKLDVNITGIIVPLRLIERDGQCNR